MRKLLLLIVLVLGISCNHLEEGEVISKEIQPENTSLIFMPMMIGKTTTMIPYYIHDNEDFVLTIKNGDEIEEVYVTEESYKSHRVGSTLIVNDDYSYSDDNNSKKRK